MIAGFGPHGDVLGIEVLAEHVGEPAQAMKIGAALIGAAPTGTPPTREQPARGGKGEITDVARNFLALAFRPT